MHGPHGPSPTSCEPHEAREDDLVAMNWNPLPMLVDFAALVVARQVRVVQPDRLQEFAAAWRQVKTLIAIEPFITPRHSDPELVAEAFPELAIRWWDGSTMVPSDRKVDQVTLAAMYLSFFLSFIILSIVTGNFLHSKEFYVLPESGATILFGVLMGSVLKLVAHVSSHVDENELIQMTEFDTELAVYMLVIVGSLAPSIEQTRLNGGDGRPGKPSHPRRRTSECGPLL